MSPPVEESAMIHRSPSPTHAPQRRPTGAPSPALRRIAVGVDGFPEGRDAAALGHLLAQATGAEVLLVAVHSAGLLPVPPELSFKSARHEAERILREVRESDAPGSRTTIVSDYSVPRALLRVVRRHHCDLLVVGSTREGPESQIRIGDRTRQLLGQFKCALAVAPRGLYAHPRRLRRIGAGWDGGPESEAALALARSIALGAGADVQVQAIVDDRTPPFARSGLGLVAGGWDEVIEAEMDRLREQATAAASSTATKVKVAVSRGRPSDALLELSETVDLLLIGSRRWGPSARLLLGSTGEALMHGSACPVLAVPRPAP
jgi:nucleotide-binding universal stress UspA family protein